MKKYRELQKLVYSIIFPKGIPLEVGCECENSGIPFVFVGTSSAGSNIFYTEFGNQTKSFNQLKTRKEFTNLGKPLQGFDILRAINKSKVELADNYLEVGRCSYYNLDEILLINAKRDGSIKLDLSLPIQNQPEETLQKIINLIK